RRDGDHCSQCRVISIFHIFIHGAALAQDFRNVADGGRADLEVLQQTLWTVGHARSLAKPEDLWMRKASHPSRGFSAIRDVGYCLPDPSLARRTLAASSLFCVDACRSVSTSAGTVLFHSSTARSQCAAANLRRPVFW